MGYILKCPKIEIYIVILDGFQQIEFCSLMSCDFKLYLKNELGWINKDKNNDLLTSYLCKNYNILMLKNQSHKIMNILGCQDF